MDTAAHVQILDEAVYISPCTFFLAKGINPTIFFLVMGKKKVGKTEFFSLGIATGLKEEEKL